MTRFALTLVCFAVLFPACSSDTTRGTDDVGIDAARSDAGGGIDAAAIDAATRDAGTDAATVVDAGAGDAGSDAAITTDAGSDAGSDASVVPDTGVDAATANDAATPDAAIRCGLGLIACRGECVNPDNSIIDCGSCDHPCTGAHPFCAGGTCGTAPCGGVACTTSQFCCGTDCCTAGQLCCDIPGPISRGPSCADPVGGTCPTGCPGCVCASPDTLISTPSGERAIAELSVGDLVYTADEGTLRAMPIAAIHRTPVMDHRVVRVVLDTGAVLEISPGHPTADGRWFGDLRAGDVLDGARVESAELVPYLYGFTYDILPASDTGTYVAGGVLIGSTLATAGAPVALAQPASE